MGAGLLIHFRERPKIGTDFQIFDIAFWQTLGKGTPFKGLPSTPFKGGLNDLIESGFVNDKLPFIMKMWMRKFFFLDKYVVLYIITCAVIMLAGGGLGKMEERQGEKREKNYHLGHSERSLGLKRLQKMHFWYLEPSLIKTEKLQDAVVFLLC